MKKFQFKTLLIFSALIGVFLFATGCSHKISGEFYFDLNKNGFKDFGEPNVPNVKVLITKDGVPWKEGLTKPDGTFELTYMPKGKEEPVFALFVDQDYLKNNVLENPDVIAQISGTKDYSVRLTDFESEDDISDLEVSSSKAVTDGDDDESELDDKDDDDDEATGTTETQKIGEETIEVPKGAVKAWKQKNAHLVVALNFDFSSSLNNVSTYDHKIYYKCPTVEDSNKTCDPYNMKFFYPAECTPNDMIIPDVLSVKPSSNLRIDRSTNIISFMKSAVPSSTKGASTSSTTASGPLSASTTVAMQKISAQDIIFEVNPEKLSEAEKDYEIKLSATCFGKNLDLEPIKITVAKEKPADEVIDKIHNVKVRIEETARTPLDSDIENSCLPCIKVTTDPSKENKCSNKIHWDMSNNIKNKDLLIQTRSYTVAVTNMSEKEIIASGELTIQVEGKNAEFTPVEISPSSSNKFDCAIDAKGVSCFLKKLEKIDIGEVVIYQFKLATPTKWKQGQQAIEYKIKAQFKVQSETAKKDDTNEPYSANEVSFWVDANPSSCDPTCKHHDGTTTFCTYYE